MSRYFHEPFEKKNEAINFAACDTDICLFTAIEHTLCGDTVTTQSCFPEIPSNSLNSKNMQLTTCN